jgi:hypothetical protein
MRERHVGDCLDLFDFENPEIGLPSVILEERIVVRAQGAGHAHPGDGLVEHPANRDAVHSPTWTAKPIIRRVNFMTAMT